MSPRILLPLLLTALPWACSVPSPELPSVRLVPDRIATDDVVVAVVEAVHPDGETVTLAYEWTVDGQVVDEDSSSLDGELWFERDQELRVGVKASSDEVQGTTTWSDPLIVENTPPQFGDGAVSIEPTQPRAGLDDMLCLVEPTATDVDDDPIAYRIEWTVDDLPFEDAESSLLDGDTVPWDVLEGDQIWACTVTPSDGTLDGPAVGAQVRIRAAEFEGWGSTSVDLADADIIVDGPDDDLHIGAVVAAAGDMDGDGRGDVAVGRGGSGPETSVWIVAGASTVGAPVRHEYDLGRQACYRSSLAGAGDTDGDGLADLIMTTGEGGTAHLLTGAALNSGGDTVLIEIGRSNTGRLKLSGAGDVDGDGLADILLAGLDAGDATKAWVVSGADLIDTSSFPIEAAAAVLVPEEHDSTAQEIAGLGDVNGDGHDDVALAFPYLDANGVDAGSVRVLYGDPSTSRYELAAADVKVDGEPAWVLGGCLAGPGDVDGDGGADLLIGSGYGSHDGNPLALLLTAADMAEGGWLEPDDASLHFILEGSDGLSVSGAGDVDADGIPDLLFGNTDAGSEEQGAAFLVLGASIEGAAVHELEDADYQFVGEAMNDWAGYAVSSAGDMNADGLDDLLVGAPSGASSNAGRAYTLLTP